jgi:hypothetical protein
MSPFKRVCRLPGLVQVLHSEPDPSFCQDAAVDGTINRITASSDTAPRSIDHGGSNAADDDDKLLARGYDRFEARAEVQDAVARILQKWETRA